MKTIGGYECHEPKPELLLPSMNWTTPEALELARDGKCPIGPLSFPLLNYTVCITWPYGADRRRWRIYAPDGSLFDEGDAPSYSQAVQQVRDVVAHPRPHEYLPKPKQIWQRPADFQTRLKELS